MFPIALDLTRLPVLLAGDGDFLLKRLAYLDEARAGNVAVFCAHPSPALRAAAAGRLVERLPEPGDMDNYTVVMVAGLSREASQAIVAQARLAGRLVNVEDVNDLCDFYFTANIRRGDLVIAVSTSGASPTLARKIREWIAVQFGPEWGGRVAEIGSLRRRWKTQGAGFFELIERTEAFLEQKGWLHTLNASPQRANEQEKEPA